MSRSEKMRARQMAKTTAKPELTPEQEEFMAEIMGRVEEKTARTEERISGMETMMKEIRDKILPASASKADRAAERLRKAEENVEELREQMAQAAAKSRKKQLFAALRPEMEAAEEAIGMARVKKAILTGKDKATMEKMGPAELEAAQKALTPDLTPDDPRWELSKELLVIAATAAVGALSGISLAVLAGLTWAGIIALLVTGSVIGAVIGFVATNGEEATT